MANQFSLMISEAVIILNQLKFLPLARIGEIIFGVPLAAHAPKNRILVSTGRLTVGTGKRKRITSTIKVGANQHRDKSKRKPPNKLGG